MNPYLPAVCQTGWTSDQLADWPSDCLLGGAANWLSTRAKAGTRVRVPDNCAGGSAMWGFLFSYPSLLFSSLLFPALLSFFLFVSCPSCPVVTEYSNWVSILFSCCSTNTNITLIYLHNNNPATLWTRCSKHTRTHARARTHTHTRAMGNYSGGFLADVLGSSLTGRGNQPSPWVPPEGYPPVLRLDHIPSG